MTVRISKPKFNLREKLNELDYGQVPYEKMPSGSIIQVEKSELTGSGQINTTSSSYQDSGLFIDFQPKFVSSNLLVTCVFNAQSGNQTNSGIVWTVFRQINGTATTSSFNVFPSASPRTISYMSASGYIHEGTTAMLEDKPRTIETVQYRLFFHSHNGSANVGVARDWGGAHFTVMEVRE
jgi:hypothetical protein